jgi:hypothetical protein
MKRIVGGVLVLCLALPVLAAEDKPQDKQTPEQQYKALLKEFQDGVNAYREAMTKAKTNEERRKVFEEKYPRPEKFVPKFLALAEKHPKDPSAADALVWVATNSAARGGKDNPQSKALAILQRDHAASPKLAPVCLRLVYSADPASESFLRTVLEKSSSKEVKGCACLALAQMLKNRSERGEPKAAKEAETLLERAAKDYADVKFGRDTLGAKAKSELYDLRHLAVGKPAPEVEGEDQDGKKFKLSDYKGKVVLLDFWSQF